MACEAHAKRVLMETLMSEEGVPLTKPEVMPVLNECESISSQPRVLPFLRTSDLRKIISKGMLVRRGMVWSGREGKLTYASEDHLHHNPELPRKRGQRHWFLL